MKNGNSRVRSRLKWHLFGAWTVFLVAVAWMVFLAMGVKLSSLILNSEIEKLRPAATDLKEVCADHFMSPSDRQVAMRFAKIMKEFPDLAYVLFVDRDGKIHSRGNHTAIDSLKEHLSEFGLGEEDVNVFKAQGESYIDIAEVTQTRPPLRVHVGFPKSITDARRRSVLWNRAAMTLVILTGGLVGGFVFSTWFTHPLIDLSTRAERLSMGDMQVRLDLKSRGEIGRVYHSLERLRESVLYAFRRLDSRGQRRRQQMVFKAAEESEPAEGESRWRNPT
jgi:methyl-accepting chemotaxis protein